MALFIIALMNINSYAAVSGNDGSAFVTKAEFDALVNTFNEQMDAYQAGLNSKIDGAIANYLAGLSATKTETRSPLVKPTKGVWSASTTSDKKEWSEGIMKLDGLVFLARWYNGSTELRGGHRVTLTPKSATSFNEHIITNVDSVNKVAQYIQYAKTKQEGVIFAGNTTTTGDYVKANYDNTSITLAAFYWTPGGVPVGGFRTGGTGDGANINTWASGAVTRDVEEIYIDSVIVTPTSVEFPYFNLQSTAGANALWCQDPNLSTNNKHTDKPRFDRLWSQWALSGTCATNVGTGTVNFNGSFKLDVSRYEGGSGKVTTLPFLGFTNVITDWNQLYVDTFDSYVDDLISKGKAEYVTDSNNKKHLTIINGFPLVKAEKDEVIYLPIKFDKVDGEWKNIDIWLKASAFKPNEDVKSTTEEDIIKPNVNDGTNLQTSVYSNAVTLNANAGETADTKGTGMIKFKMPKDGYVFMKWSVAGNEAKGGGVFHPQDMKVELVEK